MAHRLASSEEWQETNKEQSNSRWLDGIDGVASGDGLGVEDLPRPGSHAPCAAFRRRRGQPGGRRSGERGAAAQHGCLAVWLGRIEELTMTGDGRTRSRG